MTQRFRPELYPRVHPFKDREEDIVNILRDSVTKFYGLAVNDHCAKQNFFVLERTPRDAPTLSPRVPP